MVSHEQAISEQQVSQNPTQTSSEKDSSQAHNFSDSTQMSLKYAQNQPTPPPNPRLASMAAKKARLEAQLLELQQERSALVAEARLSSGLDISADLNNEQRTQQALTSANAVIKDHIMALHRYNEIKDIGQGLMGLVAEKRGVRISEVMAEYEMGEKD